MKKLLSIVLALVVIFSCVSVVPVSAATTKVIEIDGIRQKYGPSTVIQNGRTLVPMRGIFETLGATVEWDEATQTVTGKTADVEVVLTIGSNKATVNGEEKTLDVPAQIIDSSTFVPARFVAEALNCDVDWKSDQFFGTVSITTGKTYNSTLPQTEAEEAVIKRARQLSEITWTPKGIIPTRQPSTTMKTFNPGTEYKGIIYSSTLVNDKGIGDFVSFETYLTALANPDSVIYTKQLSALANADAFYGMVCNGLVRYSLGIKEYYNCASATFRTIPGMSYVKAAGEYSIDEIKLCDLLLSPGHVAVVTDILRDDDGKIVAIEICDAVRPIARRAKWSVDYFYSNWGAKYDLLRYDTSRAPLFDEEERALLFESGLQNKLPEIAVDYGNKSNYIAGEETVISVFAEGDNVVEIYKNGELSSETKVSGRAKFARKLGQGYYQVKLKGSDEYAEFYVSKPEISYTVNDGKLTITAASGDENSKIRFVEYRHAIAWGSKETHLLTEEEIKTGVITRDLPTDYPVAFKVYFENEYGIWTHLQIDVVE